MIISFRLKCPQCWNGERVSTQTVKLLSVPHGGTTLPKIKRGRWWRRGGGACLVVLLHYDLPVKHPSSLPQHVEVKLRKHWWHNAPPRHLSVSRFISSHQIRWQNQSPYVGCRTAWWWWGSSSSRTTRYTGWGVSQSTFQFCARTAEQSKWSSAPQWLPQGKRRWTGCICGGRGHTIFTQKPLKITCMLKQTGLEAETHTRHTWMHNSDQSCNSSSIKVHINVVERHSLVSNKLKLSVQIPLSRADMWRFSCSCWKSIGNF